MVKKAQVPVTSQIDVSSLLKDVPKEFGSDKPTRSELANFVAGFGVGEGIALASLILAAWAYLFPRAPERSPRCRKKMVIAQRICGAKIVHMEFDELKKQLKMFCGRGHITTKRMG